MSRISRRKWPDSMYQPSVSSKENAVQYMVDFAIMHDLRITDKEWSDLDLSCEIWDILTPHEGMTFAEKRTFIEAWNKYINL